MLRKIFIASIFLILSGCSRTIEYYEYSPEKIHTEDNGSISIGLHGEFINNDKLFRKKTVEGNPYTLVVSFVQSSGVMFCISKLHLSQGESTQEVKLKGDECGREEKFKDFEPGTRLYSFEKVNIELGKSVWITILGSVGPDGVQKEYRVELKNKYRVEKRNDFLDMIMSV